MQDQISPSSDDPKKKNETVGEVRKQKKRIEESRDALKEKNREKLKRLKSQLGKIDDLIESRDMWRNRSKEYAQEIDKLKQALDNEQKNRLEREKWIEEQNKVRTLEIQRQKKIQVEYDNQIEELKKKLKE
jgi:hypothetical protein